ncbi:TM1812 family CRISPR-associated protein [Methanospirillum hungatei]|uniref:TM1812 family CRISPR-associated protein n=1 Tax=Methanospirillum hungatei TaxID=2203 RepID=UPI0026F252B8|nr:TM1812 family CRISPR-associated protein [Methanospirillum hungatei]MCA1917053.1 TM1812 family CRISPR-associated protein [Methanospirillum hungatei]
MRKCLSFVGTGELKPARYIYNEFQCDTSVIQEALAKFYNPDLTILFVTDKAKSNNLSTVITSLSEHPYTTIDIPDGRTESELWMIFDKIIHAVSPDDEILLDITHAYRFLPFLAFLTALYIREVTGATLAGILYGAFEAGEDIYDQTGQTRRITPVSDLTSFIILTDWIMAVRSFISFADARGIQAMVSESRIPGFISSPHQGTESGSALIHLADSLHQFTAGIQLSRPIEARESGIEVLKHLVTIRNQIHSDFSALNPVLDKITEISPFKQDMSTSPSWSTLEAQLAIISYQVEKGLYLQAAELAREWMVTAVICYHGLFSSWLNENIRTDVEGALHALTIKKKGKQYKSSPIVRRLEKNPEWKKIADIWHKIARIRNDLAHCGMREGREDAKTLEKKVIAIPEELTIFYQILRRT